MQTKAIASSSPKECHLAAIKKNNMKDKNADQDRTGSKIRTAPDEGSFWRIKKGWYKGLL